MRSLSIVAISLVLLTASCNRKTAANQCETVLCTAIFAAVAVQVTDADSNAVTLDEAYTINTMTGERINIHQGMTSGYYVVLDDNYRPKIAHYTADFRFIGKKNGVVVIDEHYSITGDCCHVSKVSGKEVIVL